MTKTEELAQQISATLAASPLGWDEKVRALGMARITLNRNNQDPDQWRKDRVARGPVGSGKKTDAMVESMKSKRGGK